MGRPTPSIQRPPPPPQGRDHYGDYIGQQKHDLAESGGYMLELKEDSRRARLWNSFGIALVILVMAVVFAAPIVLIWTLWTMWTKG